MMFFNVEDLEHQIAQDYELYTQEKGKHKFIAGEIRHQYNEYVRTIDDTHANAGKRLYRTMNLCDFIQHVRNGHGSSLGMALRYTIGNKEAHVVLEFNLKDEIGTFEAKKGGEGKKGGAKTEETSYLPANGAKKQPSGTHRFYNGPFSSFNFGKSKQPHKEDSSKQEDSFNEIKIESYRVIYSSCPFLKKRILKHFSDWDSEATEYKKLWFEYLRERKLDRNQIYSEFGKNNTEYLDSVMDQITSLPPAKKDALATETEAYLSSDTIPNGFSIVDNTGEDNNCLL